MTTFHGFRLGQTVANFGRHATVVGFHVEAGFLVLEKPGIGRWIADPAKTEAVLGAPALDCPQLDATALDALATRARSVGWRW